MLANAGGIACNLSGGVVAFHLPSPLKMKAMTLLQPKLLRSNAATAQTDA